MDDERGGIPRTWITHFTAMGGSNAIISGRQQSKTNISIDFPSDLTLMMPRSKYKLRRTIL